MTAQVERLSSSTRAASRRAIAGADPGAATRYSGFPRRRARCATSAASSTRGRTRCVGPSCASKGRPAQWTARFASPIYDAPEAILLDTAGLLVVRYGFLAYALVARTGELAWSHASGTPTVAIARLAATRPLLLQTELETIALRPDGSVAWRAAHSDVVTDAQLMAGRLDLTSYSGQHVYLDARTGR